MKTMSLMGSLMLLATTLLAAISIAPGAAAHDCYSLVPGQAGCGSCTPTSQEHDHRTVGNVQWCGSDPPECATLAARLAFVDCSALLQIEYTA